MRKYTTGQNNNYELRNFFGDMEGYSFFVKKMQEVAEKHNLPLALEHTAPMELTMQDIKRFSQTFRKDTGLDIEFKAFTCDNCDKLHLIMFVDYKE